MTQKNVGDFVVMVLLEDLAQGGCTGFMVRK